uniref:2-aminoethylphosphonate--pyruvate transaminase n=1 Tax=Candidatus Kentrum sp. MB TaxID=2138164 RepID=A0A450Y1W3_9GAMM|nr:MAG: 2-aminoethylphosphonate-pyruvate transaminase [Candidatus Kentron sp. MB]VFK35531.1 MAG: 2-aminoethylphosphonate-pyruvate transaminase [Candidatus Kentron sp. MB]VFK77333.1 MAG: 2-aminoethylphosphonate-pyruvate transaminase [Candidatus Kentron sp. MB]
MTQRTVLLNPGPVTLTERVRNALLQEDQCHREPEFAKLTLDIKERLSRVYPQAQSQYEAILLTGSGTCAVEAMLNTLVPQDRTTLVMENGVYGERMTAMLRTAGRPVVTVPVAWTASMDLDAAEQLLRKDPDISHVVAVHNETTTGRLNDIRALANLCRQYDKDLMLDAVSGFAGEWLDFHGWQPLAVAATANKCLHGAPGVSFVMVRSEQFTEGKSQAKTLYLDLFRYHSEQQTGFSPFTQAVHVCHALREALREFDDQGGWEARHRRYRDLSTRIRATLSALGIRRLLAETDYSAMISSFHLPHGWNYSALHNVLRKEGFVIYAGQGDLQKSIFRIANMGDIRDDDLERLFRVFSDRVCG